MPFEIPNEADVGTAAAQAGLYSADVLILAGGYDRTGVVSGCAVTAQGTPNNTVAVAAGTALVKGTQVTVALGNVTIAANAVANPRIDLVVVNGSGTKSVIQGTAAASPVPSITGLKDADGRIQYAVLAQVYLPASENPAVITTADIVDKRVFCHIPSKSGVYVAATIANDASEASRAAADQLCDGTDDQAEINAAFSALPT